MKGIIKSQLYETKVTLSLWIAVVVAFGLTFIEWIEAPDYFMGTGPFTGSAALAESGNHTNAIYFFCFVIAYFMCRDWKNKTLYLDVLSGYSRKEVFWGRLIPAFVIGVIAVLVLTYGNVVYHSIVNGWGSDITAGNVMIVMLEYVLLLFRLMGEMVLLSVIIRRTSVVFILVPIMDYLEFSLLIAGSQKIECPWYFGLFISQSVTAPYIDEVFDEAGEIVQTYSYGAVSQDDVTLMLSSIAIGVVCLLIAYRIFKKKQLS